MTELMMTELKWKKRESNKNVSIAYLFSLFVSFNRAGSSVFFP